jgi:hypothetical protein
MLSFTIDFFPERREHQMVRPKVSLIEWRNRYVVPLLEIPALHQKQSDRVRIVYLPRVYRPYLSKRSHYCWLDQDYCLNHHFSWLNHVKSPLFLIASPFSVLNHHFYGFNHHFSS